MGKLRVGIVRRTVLYVVMGMESQISVDARHQLDRFCRQYLQVTLGLDYPTEEHLRNDAFQQSIYSRLFSDDVQYTPPPRYQLRVLKELMKRIEASIQDWDEQGISDDLMNCLAVLLSTSLPSEETSAQQKAYVTYSLSSLTPQFDPNPSITLHEARNILAAAGTTGLRTWEAGHVLATDGDDDVVASFSTNFYLNGLQEASHIEGKELKWGHALTGGEDPQWNLGRHIDLVLGADLTYDPRNIPPLLSTFGDLFELYPDVEILIAATVRSEETFAKFPDACKRNGYRLREINFEILKAEEQQGPFFSDMAPVRLCIITKT